MGNHELISPLYWQIGKMRYVSVRDFKGKVLIDIREYWMDQEGEMKPGRKGNSLYKNGCWAKLWIILLFLMYI